MMKSEEGNIILTPLQQKEKNQMEQENQKRLAMKFEKDKEELMRKSGVIEIVFLKSTPAGIFPDATVIAHEWKPGETYIKGPKTATEIMIEENNNGENTNKKEKTE